MCKTIESFVPPCDENIIISTAVLIDELKFHLKVRVWIIFEWSVSVVDYHQ